MSFSDFQKVTFECGGHLRWSVAIYVHGTKTLDKKGSGLIEGEKGHQKKEPEGPFKLTPAPRFSLAAPQAASPE
jgi:hypothetical protein